MYIGFVWVTINVARCNNFHCTTRSFPLPSTVLEKQRWCYCQTNATNQPSNNEQQELYSPESFGFSQVGTIRGPHGVHGELKIVATSDFAHLRLMKKATRYLLLPNRKYPRPVLLLSGKKASQQNTFIIRLKHITCREQAAELKQAKLFVRSGEAIELEKDEEYLAKSLLSMEALHMHSQLVLGKIVNVYTREEVLSDKKPGAQDILASISIEPVSLQPLCKPKGFARNSNDQMDVMFIFLL